MFPLFTTFFTITDADIAKIIAYASDLIGNFLPVILIFIGLAIAGTIIWWFLGRR